MAQAFAGPFCRCYADDRDRAAALVAGIDAWRRALAAALGNRLPAPLEWREDPNAAGFTADLGDAGWQALRLFAFYAERSELELPDTVPALLELDREYRVALDAKFATSCYGHLLACRVWLPLDLPITFRAPLPDGEQAEIGSLMVLRDQLRWLNQRSFAADEAAIAGWSDLPAPAGGALLPAAQRGFAALWAASSFAVARRLPLVVRAG